MIEEKKYRNSEILLNRKSSAKIKLLEEKELNTLC
jgi:hypothetical protein